ncbi:MAG: 30S ribosomal protein S1 [Candidatus Wildermuthbacteria bacterium RIFCSPHIGHO2_02_FULL_49_9]|uniref:30S ribosomal protein S1 n=1 Tax=Candidatus Wildermuthbacteria bacterium RIFCSPHIGHO2_02_FULL_49_9 TaxID=1802456 RepID=A0A1G2REQ9_9BACT|nr:MAG: 30S ribosomal protein S1 [Candidatus Wildermuthbacteria bacterium RIFCSPHIGHO2_02_FULL_49_9]
MQIMVEKPVEKLGALRPFKMGDIVEGVVVGIGRSAVYLNLGPQGTGIIFGREFQEEKDQLKGVKVGDVIAAKIVDLENEEGYIELSLREAGRELTWGKLKEQKAKEELLKVKITGANKGGLLANVSGVQAFLPVSQLAQEHYPKVEDGDSQKILQALQAFMGQELEVEIFDLDPKEGKIILSERLKERRKVKEILSQYKVGDVVEGEITGVVDFGAFVRFGSAGEEIEGLIHISEIDWQIIEDPSLFLKVGDKVKAQIIDISNARASLSLKTLKEDPWKEAAKKYLKGGLVKGRVTKLNPFGAFVEIEPKIQGLCHISEFGTRKAMEEALGVGSTLRFQILEINPEEHRMSLRLALPFDSAQGEQEGGAIPESQPQTQEPKKEQAE